MFTAVWLGCLRPAAGVEHGFGFGWQHQHRGPPSMARLDLGQPLWESVLAPSAAAVVTVLELARLGSNGHFTKCEHVEPPAQPCVRHGRVPCRRRRLQQLATVSYGLNDDGAVGGSEWRIKTDFG